MDFVFTLKTLIIQTDWEVDNRKYVKSNPCIYLEFCSNTLIEHTLIDKIL